MYVCDSQSSHASGKRSLEAVAVAGVAGMHGSVRSGAISESGRGFWVSGNIDGELDDTVYTIFVELRPIPPVAVMSKIKSKPARGLKCVVQ